MCAKTVRASPTGGAVTERRTVPMVLTRNPMFVSRTDSDLEPELYLWNGLMEIQGRQI